MLLSKVVLNVRHRETYRLLADIYAQHRFVMSAFPDLVSVEVGSHGAQRELNILYRIETPAEGQIALLVQSAETPDWIKVVALHPNVICEAQQKEDNRNFIEGDRCRFRLRANPTVCRVNRDADGKRNPRREGLVKEAEQIAWIVRMAERGGFAVNPEAVLVNPRGKRGGVKPLSEAGDKTRGITCFAVDFDGTLRVTDPEIFARSLREGIGRGKAWGCGLLTVARI